MMMMRMRGTLFMAMAVATLHEGVQAFVPPNVVSVSRSVSVESVEGFGPSPSSSSSSTALSMLGFGQWFGRNRQKKTVARIPITDAEVRSLFNLWNNALATGDSRIVAARYSKNPVLLPTVSDIPRTNYELVKEYFDAFLLRKPQGRILDGKITIGPNWAMDCGLLEFFMAEDGTRIKSRYSFVYVFEEGKWKISHHHTSMMPEGLTVPKEINEAEVRNLFHLWNDALATLDADSVAKRYSKNAVLLPTVSDIPRSNYQAIKSYFEDFLKKKPQGTILESNVKIGTNWCQDAGIYEFAMGADGSKVKGRYSFVYVFEDGEWKISHHHSSVMPEGLLNKPAAPPSITKEQVRALFDRWNAALATLDPDVVVQRYAKEAVLLPTVSDLPRTTPFAIKDYFKNFCAKRPQGVITEGSITLGEGWAQDAGIYKFTMDSDGSQVMARYSFIYIYEDGDWKISHHHSSVMPEAFLGKPSPAKKAVEGSGVGVEVVNGASKKEMIGRR